MFTIKDVKKHTLSYKCDCGATGKCMFVPVTGEGSLVMDLKCPMCGECERLCIKKEIEGDSLQWAIILDNDLVGEFDD